MLAVPADMPETSPEPDMVATAVLSLVQVPLPDASVSGVVAPAQSTVVPVIDNGTGLTVTVVADVHPLPSV